MKWVTIISRSLPDWERFGKGKREVIPFWEVHAFKSTNKEQQKQSLDPEEGRLDTMPAGNWEPLEVSN